MTQSAREVRDTLVRALRLDLIGPDPVHHAEDQPYAAERLPMSPSRWYLSGFLIPRDAPDDQRADETNQEELDLAGDADPEGDDDQAPDKPPARRAFLPSSIGLSVLVPASTTSLDATASWGDYERDAPPVPGGEPAPETKAGPPPDIWRRTQRSVTVRVAIPDLASPPVSTEIPDSRGLKIVISARLVDDESTGLPAGTRAVAVFLVNERPATEFEEKDVTFAFQATLGVSCAETFVARPDPRRGNVEDDDERIAELQYADVAECATGHGVSPAWNEQEASCTRVWTTWTPCAFVPVVEPARLDGVMRSMDELAAADDAQLRAGLEPLVRSYGAWITDRRANLPTDPARAATARALLDRADEARRRITRGITLVVEDATARRAFQIANRAMAEAARRREAQKRGVAPAAVPAPAWYPFQLAFLLLNLNGIANPVDDDRELVDLLFFPTGGGKTEAYLGLAAFTLVLRRLTRPGIASAGVAVLMRYTLRLLTLDQLSRAAGLVCALERLRLADPATLGTWPFEIGLWVGRSATPNRMGAKGDGDEHSARMRTQRFQSNAKHNPSPIPIENCPWCGTRFTRDSFDLKPNANQPRDLRIVCVNPACEFTGDRALPIVAVDEPLYRRLPCWIIATVDKFAALPFEARAGALFGLVDRHDANGFYGAADPNIGTPIPGGQLPPPELIIQDELHLISGPLGTIAGLYETAVDTLSTREIEGRRIRPKIIASTATVRRAEHQIRALFTRKGVALFPPASPDRDDSFFARTADKDTRAPRLYLGLVSPGRSLKVLALRAYIALLSASLRAYRANGGDRTTPNPADPYLTLLGYFNSLRELGGTRRIVEDEVNSRVRSYGQRRRVDEAEDDRLFDNREIEYEVLELTSRVTTNKVADAKRRLERPWTTRNSGERVDVALATNMISVGLDITRLGLMVVLGQPKGSAEYIQSTSRVGRDSDRPGLVITLLTVNKPRDRSHFERFGFYHRTFYRSVEATSVTPFAPRAVDRVLPALVVAMARHGVRSLTPPLGAGGIEAARQQLEFLLTALARRADEYDLDRDAAERTALRQKLRQLAAELLDAWSAIAHEQTDAGGRLKYQQYEKEQNAQQLLYDPLDSALATLSAQRRRFKAARSMRDVEQEVVLLKREPQ